MWFGKKEKNLPDCVFYNILLVLNDRCEFGSPLKAQDVIIEDEMDDDEGLFINEEEEEEEDEDEENEEDGEEVEEEEETSQSDNEKVPYGLIITEREITPLSGD